MNFIRRWMAGRHGNDQLNLLLYGVGLVCWLLSSFVESEIFYVLGILILAYGLFRSMSRNLSARQRENDKFLSLFAELRRKRDQRKDADHRYFKCPSCGQTLRVPRGKGKISITCRKCGTVFIEKT